jgi:hypothetical protein
MKYFGYLLLAIGALFLVMFISKQLWGGFASLAVGFLAIAVSIVFVAVFSKAYRNWPS